MIIVDVFFVHLGVTYRNNVLLKPKKMRHWMLKFLKNNLEMKV